MATSSPTLPAPRTSDEDGFVEPIEYAIADGVKAYWLDQELCIDGFNIALTADQALTLAAIAFAGPSARPATH